jgi:hypothetical protein
MRTGAMVEQDAAAHQMNLHDAAEATARPAVGWLPKTLITEGVS